MQVKYPSTVNWVNPYGDGFFPLNISEDIDTG